MTEEEVKLATCQILATGESGTGWLVSPEHILTAYHCVDFCEEPVVGDMVRVRFGAGASAFDHEAIISALDPDLDICLLKLSVAALCRPIPIELHRPQPGARCYAFGYPGVKLELGHILHGILQQVFSERVLGIDLDVSVQTGSELSDYSGMSGAALMVGSRCCGLLRVSVDRSLGAVSFVNLAEFLRSHGVITEPASDSVDDVHAAQRPDFDELLESRVLAMGTGYLLLDGAHGIGKSTYCRNFTPRNATVDVIGVYALSDRSRGWTPALQSQPEIFVGWLESLWSSRVTGRPARLAERPYSQLIQSTASILQAFADRSAESGNVSVLFIDGINEATGVSGDALRRFVDLLPPVLPTGIVIIITGVGLEALTSDLGALAKGAQRLTLPILDLDEQQALCASLLRQDHNTGQMIAFICGRAQGHPLYLHYLIDIVNQGIPDDDLHAIPPFTGAIQDYYETIWSQLLNDQEAVNLLGIIARLRWGIATSAITSMLTAAESTAFVPTMARIRHLLRDPDKTEIYHSSFSEFIAQKTLALDEWIQGRLMEFCVLTASAEYGPLNRIYHGLLADAERQATALRECKQEWVDRSVLLGAEPDRLLGDIDDALAAAARLGTAAELIRLLLLSQRLTFRYNTLFAQSAALVARALIALGETQQALRHIVRYEHLIVTPDDAFAVVVMLIQTQRLDEARALIQKIQTALAVLADREQSQEEFLDVTCLQLHLMALVKLAGGEAYFKPFLLNIGHILRHARNGFSESAREGITLSLVGDMLGAALCFEGKYTPLAAVPLPPDADRRQRVVMLRNLLSHAHTYACDYGMTLLSDRLQLVLSDIEEQIDAPLAPTDTSLATVDVLISVGASPALVTQFVNGVALDPQALPLFTKNRAMPDETAFDEAYVRLRAGSFLSVWSIPPTLLDHGVSGWESALQSLGQAIAWCDGTARRAKVTSDLGALDEVRSFLNQKIFPELAFSLSVRITWENSYFIPEHIVPLLYDHLTRLYVDCLPSDAKRMLDHMDQAFSTQLGLYQEGFREILRSFTAQFAKANLGEELNEQLLDLMFRWKDYIQSNVQNRYELIPEMLQMIPLFTQLGASEEALRVYREVLAVSMGPSWYKEDQLSLMSGTLKAFPQYTDVSDTAYQQIAANLERASGEMTFQRYVRAEKGNFIGELCRRKRYTDAISYFKHQSCGSVEQLLEQARTGDLDRVSDLVGMRYPGGSLEEQASLLEILKNIQGHADWRLCWALLEIYQNGDKRHLGEWGEAYARIVLSINQQPTDIAWVTSRVQIICNSMNAQNAWFMLRGMVHILPDSCAAPFKAILEKVQGNLSRQQLDRLVSGYAGRYGPLETKKQKTAPDTDESSQDPNLDALYLPGTFGKQSAITESRRALDEAKKQFKRKNEAVGISACLESIKVLQSGGWSVWDADASTREAVALIESHTKTAEDLTQLYGPLALQERYSERWRIASRLTELFASKLNAVQHASVTSAAIDHISQIIGEASVAPFTYMGANDQGDPSSAAFDLILWSLDHPKWERRDSAAAMLLWLLRFDDTYLKEVATLACSMTAQNRADIASAVLDKLSIEKPVVLWQRVSRFLDTDRIINECQHAGRYATLIRIAERAASHEELSAAAFAGSLRETLVSTSSVVRGAAPEIPAYWPSTLDAVWQTLIETGALDHATIRRFESTLATVCAPLEVSVAHELEGLIAKGSRESATFPVGRWTGKLRYAMNVALFPYAGVECIFQVEAALRSYNPASLTEPTNGRQLIENLTQAVFSANPQTYRPSDKDWVYLDFKFVTEFKHHSIQVELVSRLIPSMPQAMRPPFDRSFTSVEMPHAGHDARLAVCGRVHPVMTHFGTLTPAVPTPQFLQLLGVGSSATVRYHWRDGIVSGSTSGGRQHEASLLAVRRGAFALPPGWRIGWALRVNNDIVATLDRY